MTELQLTESQCFQKEEKIYKIIEVQKRVLTIIKFIDIDLIEKDLEKEDFLKEFSDSTLLEESYFDQLATDHNENEIRMNLENTKLIEEIKSRFKKFLPHRMVWKKLLTN